MFNMVGLIQRNFTDKLALRHFELLEEQINILFKRNNIEATCKNDLDKQGLALYIDYFVTVTGIRLYRDNKLIDLSTFKNEISQI